MKLGTLGARCDWYNPAPIPVFLDFIPTLSSTVPTQNLSLDKPLRMSAGYTERFQYLVRASGVPLMA